MIITNDVATFRRKVMLSIPVRHFARKLKGCRLDPYTPQVRNECMTERTWKVGTDKPLEPDDNLAQRKRRELYQRTFVYDYQDCIAEVAQHSQKWILRYAKEFIEWLDGDGDKPYSPASVAWETFFGNSYACSPL